jgi:hypothetical protein
MKHLFLIMCLFLCGCASKPMDWSGLNPFSGSGQGNGEVPPVDPMQAAGGQLNRYGVALIAIGLIFAALTRFRTGWGLSIAAAGFLMTILAWTYDQWWTPWLGLGTILAYAGYKVWNWRNPNVETEKLLL